MQWRGTLAIREVEGHMRPAEYQLTTSVEQYDSDTFSSQQQRSNRILKLFR